MPPDRSSRDHATLIDIRVAVDRIMSFVRGLSYAQFDVDVKTQLAVQHQLLVIGEAVKRLSDDLRTHHPGIPWVQIAGMRDHLIHGYDAVDLEEVWKTVTVDLPELSGKLGELIALFDAPS
jgi:uncharacterized protein with HEPN domain